MIIPLAGDDTIVTFEIVVGAQEGKFSSKLHLETIDGKTLAVPVFANILGNCCHVEALRFQEQTLGIRS